MIEFTAGTAIGGGVHIFSSLQKVEYISSSGTQYIDTGFTANQNTTVDLKFKMIDTSTSYAIMFGSRNAWAQRAFLLFRDSANSGKATFNYGNNNATTNAQQASVTLYTTAAHTANLGKTYKIDNYTYTNPSYTFTTPTTCLLFGGRFKPTDGLTLKAMSIYYCKIYDNGTLVRDFVPMKDTTSNVGVMFDNVSGTIFNNAGSGTFTAGPVIS